MASRGKREAIAYYNDNNPYNVRALEIMVARGEIAPGVVDGRSILDVRADELRALYARGIRQFHFFAGATAGWPESLRQAGWADDREVWTGSCPCQPFSVAGKHKGLADERHLWPAWWKLIQDIRPPVIYGEQVEGDDGVEWLSAVLSDLEGVCYEVAPFDLPAAGVGAPNSRQRLWFVADQPDAYGNRQNGAGILRQKGQAEGKPAGSTGGRADHDIESGPDAMHPGRAEGRTRAGAGSLERGSRGHGSNPVTDAPGQGSQGNGRPEVVGREPGRLFQGPNGSIRTVGVGFGPWADVEFRPCVDRDKHGRVKYRPIKPALQPVAHGYKGRTPVLSASGNAIVPELAKTFILAYMESRDQDV